MGKTEELNKLRGAKMNREARFYEKEELEKSVRGFKSHGKLDQNVLSESQLVKAQGLGAGQKGKEGGESEDFDFDADEDEEH